MSHHIVIKSEVDAEETQLLKREHPTQKWTRKHVCFEAFDWLANQFGLGEFQPEKNHDWKRATKKRWSYKHVRHGQFSLHEFEFKHRQDAMLFKLTWC